MRLPFTSVLQQATGQAVGERSSGSDLDLQQTPNAEHTPGRSLRRPRTKEGDARSLLRLREGDIERGVAVTPKVGRIRFDEAVKDVLNDYRTHRKRSLDNEDNVRVGFLERELDVRVVCSTTSVEPPFAISSAQAFLSASGCCGRRSRWPRFARWRRGTSCGLTPEGPSNRGSAM
jgi:hypothetical protein